MRAITIADISTMAAFLRPMYCESTPRGKRIKAPASVGTETIRPIWAGLRWNCSEIKGPMAPLRTQTAKEKSKYRKALSNVGGCPDLRNALKLAMTFDVSVWILYKSSKGRCC